MTLDLLSVPRPEDLRHPQELDLQVPFLFVPGVPQATLEMFLLLLISVAGKNSKVQTLKFAQVRDTLQQMSGKDILEHGARAVQPAQWLEALQEAGMGKYNTLMRAIHWLTRGKLPEDRDSALEVPGVGWKTASCFLMYAKGAACAVLDTHLCANMRRLFPRIPKAWESTPSQLQSPSGYLAREKIFLDVCAQQDILPFILDFEIWSKSSRNLFDLFLARRTAWLDQMQQLSHIYREKMPELPTRATTAGKPAAVRPKAAKTCSSASS